jgi:hypothetical protein
LRPHKQAIQPMQALQLSCGVQKCVPLVHISTVWVLILICYMLEARTEAFSLTKLKCACMLANAGVTTLAPIGIGSCVFVWWIIECNSLRVIMIFNATQMPLLAPWLPHTFRTMYSKCFVKGELPNWVNKQTNLASLSNILVQLWEHWSNRDSHSIIKITALHYAYRYTHFPSQQVLYVVTSNERLEHSSLECMRLAPSLFGI